MSGNLQVTPFQVLNVKITTNRTEKVPLFYLFSAVCQLTTTIIGTFIV
jgi:hypothetical protein